MKSSCCVPWSATLLLACAAPAFAAEVVFRNGFDPGFQVQTPELAVGPGEETTYCYYFRVPGEIAMGVRRWSSLAGPGIQRLTLFAAYDAGWQAIELQPPGTLTQGSCGIGIGSNHMAWIYAAHDPVSELVFPADDGAGSPLASELEPAQPVFLQLHMINASDTPLAASVLLEAESLGGSAAFTASASYVTLNTNINIPPLATATVTATCAAPPGVRFWQMTTQTHHFATLAEVGDGPATLVSSTDWAHPAITQFAAPEFHTFSPSGLTYRCTYVNPTPSTIHFGESEATDETCMAIGYFFPAEHAAICINGVGPL